MTTPNLPSPIPPQARFFQWVQGYVSLIVCHTLVKAGIFEQMADQPRTAGEMADACQVRQDVLYRALRLTTAIDVTQHQGERYSLTELGRAMLKESPGSLYNGLLLSGSEGYQRPWQNFAYCLESGESAFTQFMGAPFFDYLEQNPGYGIPFLEQMKVYATLIDPALVPAYDFTPFHTVCDVGGGTGNFLKSILEANPHLTGILYDLPGVVANHVMGDMGVRVEIIPGNFFESVPPADLLILKTVLHDWSDPKCAAILNRCREAMPPGGRLIIIDRLLTEPVNAMDSFYDLHMLVQMGGRERTANEFLSLLESVGLRRQTIITPTESPLFPLRIQEVIH